jgi:hypothetical protein
MAKATKQNLKSMAGALNLIKTYKRVSKLSITHRKGSVIREEKH